jgi:hypothetical protein
LEPSQPLRGIIPESVWWSTFVCETLPGAGA